MKEYTVTIDVTMSGDITIEANSKKEAKELAKSRYFTPSDLRDFHEINTKVVEVQ